MLASPLALPLIRLHPADNVAVARARIAPGAPLGEAGLAAEAEVPRGHKVAVAAIAVGEAVRKYGQVIGFASRPIAAGEHVHLHNMEMREGEVAHEFCADARP
ncbi:MAG: UxaA family hydrolase, partial [Acetobacteraceae bacterium]|nr:UxaA family hydrolase [Acetobacteraceae bacterium]